MVRCGLDHRDPALGRLGLSVLRLSDHEREAESIGRSYRSILWHQSARRSAFDDKEDEKEVPSQELGSGIEPIRLWFHVDVPAPSRYAILQGPAVWADDVLPSAA